MLESSVEKAFRRLVKRLRGRTIKLYTHAERDLPDRLVLLPKGAHLLAELKQPGKVPRPGQLREHARLRRLGHCVLVVDGTDWPRVLYVMRLQCKIAAMGART